MAEAKKKTRKVIGETGSLITVDASRLREALKHTFEGVTMLFDCIGVKVPVGEPIQEQEEKPVEKDPVELHDTIPAAESETASEQPEEKLEDPNVETQEEKEQDAAPADTSPVTATVTLDDITRIIVRKIKQDRSNNEKIGAILKTYGVAKVSDLPAAKYEAFLTDLSQI